jgi:hypothetical protein
MCNLLGTKWVFISPEDGILHCHRRENLKYYKEVVDLYFHPRIHFHGVAISYLNKKTTLFFYGIIAKETKLCKVSEATVCLNVMPFRMVDV